MTREMTEERGSSDQRERARISDMLRDLKPTYWVAGTFDSRRQLIRRLSSSPLPRNLVFDVLYAIDPPPTVTVVRGSFRMQCNTYTVVHSLGSGSVLKVVLLYDTTLPAQPLLEVTQRLRATLEQNQFEAPTPYPESSETAPIVRSRRPPQLGLFTVDRDFQVLGAWLSPDPALAEMRSIIVPRGNTLPQFLESALREVTADWDWDNRESCTTQMVVPIPKLVVRAIPMSNNGPVHLIVLIELLHVRYTLASAQRDFHLSDREVQVLQLLFEGHRVNEIANQLFLAESTVQDHIKHAITKTGSANRVEMTAKILGWSNRDHTLR